VKTPPNKEPTSGTLGGFTRSYTFDDSLAEIRKMAELRWTGLLLVDDCEECEQLATELGLAYDKGWVSLHAFPK
jgi:hypothetical protein